MPKSETYFRSSSQTLNYVYTKESPNEIFSFEQLIQETFDWYEMKQRMLRPPLFPLDSLFWPLLIFLMVLASKVPYNTRAPQSIKNKGNIINVCENVNGIFFLLHGVWLCNTSFRYICDFIFSHLLTYFISRKRQFLYGFLYLLTRR